MENLEGRLEFIMLAYNALKKTTPFGEELPELEFAPPLPTQRNAKPASDIVVPSAPTLDFSVKRSTEIVIPAHILHANIMAP